MRSPMNVKVRSHFYCKIRKKSDTQKLLFLFKNLNSAFLPYSSVSERCGQNGEQCRPWSGYILLNIHECLPRLFRGEY